MLLIVLAAILGLLYRVSTANADHSYDRGATPPSTYQFTRGGDYELSTVGGLAGLTAAGVTPQGTQCAITYQDGPAQSLSITPLSSDTRSTHVVANFTAPASGRAAIACDQWGAVFVDDADSSSADAAGFFLTATTVALVAGVGLGLSWLYATGMDRRRPPWDEDEDDVDGLRDAHGDELDDAHEPYDDAHGNEPYDDSSLELFDVAPHDHDR